MTRFLLAWGPAWLWVLVLFFLSELREIPDGLQPFTVIPPLLAHVIVYAVLGVALGWGRWMSGSREGGRRPPSHALLLGLGYLYGALDEWHQSFVPGRTPSVVDWVADVVGVTLGYAAALLLMGWSGSNRSKQGPPLRRHS